MFDRDYTQAIVDFSNFDASQLADAAIFGGSMLLIGMLTVFAVLILLWACLALFKFVFHGSSAKKPKEAVVEKAPAVVVENTASNDEVIAVIAAAIAMAESESSGLKFRVVSFKRK